MPVEALRIRGQHNAVNALTALALAAAAGCALAPVLYGLREYRGEPHRVEPVAVIDAVEFFDDSKGTNVGATAAALAGLGAERKLVAILGGDGKGQDFSPLAEPIRQAARAVVLIGRDAPMIRAALAACGVPLLDARDMVHAVASGASPGPRRRRRIAVARLCQLRHVRQLRTPGPGVRRSGAGTGRGQRPAGAGDHA